MNANDFFGGIKNNLDHLVEASRADAETRFTKVVSLTDKQPNVPNGVQVYDLHVTRKDSADKFRVFAAFVDEPSPEAYCDVKFRIRIWYQNSGWAFAQQPPYAGALTIGAAKAWPTGMMPNANDVPFSKVNFQMLSASSEKDAGGWNSVFFGNHQNDAVILRALGEDFFLQKQRVEDCRNGLLRCGVEFTAKHVAERMNVPEDAVRHILDELQGKGSDPWYVRG